MTKWDYLDEEYEQFDRVEKIQKSTKPEGSLTDHLRYAEPNRNGAHKRARQAARKMKEFQDNSE